MQNTKQSVTLSPADLSPTSAWKDMHRRRSNGERVRVEDYLGQLPDASDESKVLDLIYAEYVLRRDGGESPAIQEYVDRFPKFAAAIKRQFDVHQGMETSFRSAAAADTRPSDVVLAQPETRGDEPHRIGKYLILAELSSGGQATVYRALHPTLAREVVIKFSRRSLAQDSSAASRLLEEGRILADLDHPNLARVYDMGIHEGCPYLAMEYVRGRTLEQYAKEEKLSTRDIVRIVLDVSAAVSAAHRKNVVHLDIKPRNVVVDEEGHPRLVDFGLSKIRDAFRKEDGFNAITGTLQYMAPEQARGDGPQIGRRTDVFGLGGLLYSLLAGKASFSGDSFSELLDRVARNDWDRQSLESPAVPRPLRVICSRAMAERIDERYGSADEFATALNRYSQQAWLRPLLWKAAAAAVLVLAIFYAIGRFATQEIIVPPTLVANVRNPDGRYVHLADALPLQNGDELKFRGQVPAGVYASMFLLTSDGKLEKLASWEPADTPRELLYPPAEGDTAPLNGPAGTDLVFVCSSSKGPVSLEDVRAAWHDPKPLDALPSYVIAQFDSSGTRFESYGRGLGRVVRHDDPQESVRQSLGPILNRLNARFSGVAGIAFAHRE